METLITLGTGAVIFMAFIIIAILLVVIYFMRTVFATLSGLVPRTKKTSMKPTTPPNRAKEPVWPETFKPTYDPHTKRQHWPDNAESKITGSDGD